MAGRLNTDWFVVYVETPGEAPDRIDSEAQRHLLDNIERARELGAEVVRLQADDPGRRDHRLRPLARRGRTSSSAARTSRGGGSCSAARCCSGSSTRPTGLRRARRVLRGRGGARMTLRTKLLAGPGCRSRWRCLVFGSSSATTLTRARQQPGAHPHGQLPQRARRAAHEGFARAASTARPLFARAAEPAVRRADRRATRGGASRASSRSRRATSPSPARARPPAGCASAGREYQQAFGELAASRLADRAARATSTCSRPRPRAPYEAPRTRSSRSTRTRWCARATARAGRRRGT